MLQILEKQKRLKNDGEVMVERAEPFRSILWETRNEMMEKSWWNGAVPFRSILWEMRNVMMEKSWWNVRDRSVPFWICKYIYFQGTIFQFLISCKKLFLLIFFENIKLLY